MTFEELRRFEPTALRERAAFYDELSRRVARRGDTLNDEVTGLDWHWRGQAYQAAVDRFRRSHVRELDDAQPPLKSISTVLDGAADDFTRARGMLQDALDAAARISVTVHPDGRMVYAGQQALDDEQATRLRGRMKEIAGDINAALDLARRADQRAADELRKLVPGYHPGNPTKGAVDPTTVPPHGSDPRMVKKWWDSLSPAQRQWLIHHHPERVGNLDGVPILARDQANRARLARDQEAALNRRTRLEDRKAALEAELAHAGGVAPGDFEGRAERARLQAELDKVDDELAVIDRNLKGMAAIENRLYHPKAGQPPAYLVGFEPGTLDDRHDDGVADDDGRAIIAIGNPDTADHVATYVPGTGADLDGVRGDIDRADIMARDAREMAAAGEDTSVILWLGYDAPDGLTDAPSGRYADDATDDLRRFQDGLRVTHDGPASHNTVLGHSYGSTVIGYTAREGAGINADELVFVGSPGVGVDHASDLLGVSPHHVWGISAQHDMIRGVPDFWFGEDPSTDDFGGQTFDSHPGNPDDKMATHSEYWDDSNRKARAGMAGIITGNYDRVPGYHRTAPPGSGR